MTDFWLNDRAYSILKWVGLIVLPAVATLIGVVGPVWHMPNVDAIVTTVTACGVCIGAILGASTATAASATLKAAKAKESSEKEE